MKAILAALALAAGFSAWAQQPIPHAIEIPRWFEETFLNIGEDIRDAAGAGKRLMVYFGQDGCPYCTQLMQTNFTQKSIVEKTRRNFVAIALNIWGDREVTWTDGRTMSEKQFARFLKVQFTPTLLFFDERGNIVVRLNGYYPPHRFEPALDYVAARTEGRQAFADFMKSAVKEFAGAKLNEQPFFMKPPLDLRRKSGGRPLAMIFETPYCAGCDELHREGFARPEIKTLLARFDVARLSLAERSAVLTPDGGKMPADEWARSLRIAYTPSLVFFDDRGAEAFRIESYVRPFHLASAFDYVASGAYRREPSFQRFIQGRAEHLREKGEAVELWR